MPFPFSSEGGIVIGIDAPLKGQRVIDGVEDWLPKEGARAMHWEGKGLHFHGVSIWWAAQACWSSLRGIRNGEIQFCQHPDRVSMHYRVSYSQFQIWSTVWALLVLPALLAPPIWLYLVLLPVLCSVVYLFFSGREHIFRSNLRLAGIRGLADGAALELTSLRKHSLPNPRGTAAAPSGAFKGAGSC